MDRWLTSREVAQLLGYSRWTLLRLVSAGRFPAPIRVLGPTSHPRWHAPTVEAWMVAQQAPEHTGGIAP